MPSTSSIFFIIGIFGYLLMLIFPVEIEANGNTTLLADDLGGVLGTSETGWGIAIAFLVFAIVAYVSGLDETDVNAGAFSGFMGGLPGLILGIGYFNTANGSNGQTAMGLGGIGLLAGGIFLVVGSIGKSFRKSAADISL